MGEPLHTRLPADMQRWAPPEGYEPLSDEDYLLRQRYIRDRCMEMVGEKVDEADEQGRPKMKGVASLVTIGLRIQEGVERLEAIRRGYNPDEDTDYNNVTIGFDTEYPSHVADEPREA